MYFVCGQTICGACFPNIHLPHHVGMHISHFTRLLQKEDCERWKKAGSKNKTRDEGYVCFKVCGKGKRREKQKNKSSFKTNWGF